jgi:hypothetical protein
VSRRERAADALSWLLAFVALAATLAGIFALAMLGTGCAGSPVRPTEVGGSGTVYLTIETPIGPLVLYVEAGGGVPVEGEEPSGEALVCWQLGKGQPQCATVAD